MRNYLTGKERLLVARIQQASAKLRNREFNKQVQNYEMFL